MYHILPAYTYASRHAPKNNASKWIQDCSKKINALDIEALNVDDFVQVCLDNKGDGADELIWVQLTMIDNWKGFSGKISNNPYDPKGIGVEMGTLVHFSLGHVIAIIERDDIYRHILHQHQYMAGLQNANWMGM